MDRLDELTLLTFARLSKGISFRPVLTLAQNISVKIRHACYMRRLSDDRLKHTETLMVF